MPGSLRPSGRCGDVAGCAEWTTATYPVIDTYLTYLRDVRRMSPNTVESYARDLAALSAFADEGTKAVESLSRRDLEAFVRGRMASGLAPRSVARIRTPTGPSSGIG